MSDAISLVALTPNDLDAYLASAPERARRWVASQSFKALPLTHCLVPNDDGGIAEVLVGVLNGQDLNSLAHLPLLLPPGDYTLCERGLPLDAARVELGFALGSYQFGRYRKPSREPARLLAPLGRYLDEGSCRRWSRPTGGACAASRSCCAATTPSRRSRRCPRCSPTRPTASAS